MKAKKKTYKQITFPDDWEGTIADFEKEFGQTHVFIGLPAIERKAAIKEAHKIATSKVDETAAIDVKDPEDVTGKK